MKKRKNLLKLLFGRTTILAVLILIQAAFLVMGFIYLHREILWINYTSGIVGVIILLYILNVRMDSDFKLMWIIIILTAPVVGVPFFLYNKLSISTISVRKMLETSETIAADYRRPNMHVADRIKRESSVDVGIFNYLQNTCGYPAYDNASVKYFPSGETKFAELLRQLESAREFIFLEYFIVEEGQMFDPILDILKRKAKEGVEVRLLYDGTNSLTMLPAKYPKYLEKHGILCRVFSPMIPVLSTYQNNRDHRKIAVIDGRSAFTGGVNLADEYINEKKRFGHWKDTAIMVQGEAVNSFTIMFLQMWYMSGMGKAPDDFGKYLRDAKLPDEGMYNGGYIVPYGDNPNDELLTGESVYLDILNKAVDYVHIMTPYLILDEETLDCLCFAARRGVDVSLILPHIPDKKYANYLAKSYYVDLIREGVKIYEYTPGFVHAKVFVSDDNKAVVGTINLDYRSLYLHYECAAYIWKNPVIDDIEVDFQKMLEQCQQITIDDYRNYSFGVKFAGRVLRLIAPLM